jgi:hypothetical protein
MRVTPSRVPSASNTGELSNRSPPADSYMLNTVTNPSSLDLAAIRSAVGPGIGSANSRAAANCSCCGKKR